MPDSVNELEARRRELFQEMEALGDFRPGMISTNYRRCGKPNCACAQADHPGHGPQYLWNTTQNNRSRSQVIRLGPELEKVEREIANYRRFGELCSELVAVNEQLCRLRPVAELKNERELTRLKKTLQRKYSKRSRRN
jgi:hypothetical protein